MKLTVKNTRKKKVKIFDMHGAKIKGVHSFDTKTGETELFLLGELEIEGKTTSRIIRSKKNARKGDYIEQANGSIQINSDVLLVKTKIKGAYATINGKRIK